MSEITQVKIGVLGGGQLGRMMIQSAMDFNLNISVLDPDPNAPCKSLVENFTVGKLTDFDAVMAFGADKEMAGVGAGLGFHLISKSGLLNIRPNRSEM